MNNNNSFLNDYLKDLSTLARCLDKNCLIKICEIIIETAKSNGTIIIVGNGGSSAISSHVAVDFLKAVGMRAMTFNESSLITCYANDYGYKNWVKEALKSYAQKHDTIILISSSGESPNILNAAKYLKKENIKLVTFSGFNKNNSLSVLGDLNIWVDSKNYNYVEILHNQFLLMLVDLVKSNLKKNIL